MTNIFDPIIVRIEDATSSNSGSDGGNKKSSNNIMGGISGITSVVSLIGEVLSLVKEAVSGVLKPLKTMLSAILKLLSQLLRPIVDVLIIMLMPILQFLKPIIRIANEIIRPFRVLAYGLLRQANQTDNQVEKAGLTQLAITTMFAGIGNVLIGISAELIKLVTGVILDVLSIIPGVSQESINKLKGNINNVIDNTITNIEAYTLGQLMTTALSIRKGGEKEIEDMGTLFETVINSAGTNVGDKIKNMALIDDVITFSNKLKTEEIKLTNDFGTITQTIKNGFVEINGELITSIKTLIADAKAASGKTESGTVNNQGFNYDFSDSLKRGLILSSAIINPAATASYIITKKINGAVRKN